MTKAMVVVVAMVALAEVYFATSASSQQSQNPRSHCFSAFDNC